MRKVFLRLGVVMAAMILAINLDAQIQTPAASPTEEFKITVGLTEIKVTYSRPGMKGRTIFSEDGLQPYGEFWRVGANQITKIEFSDKVKIGGKEIEAGAYTLLAKPGKTEWLVNAYTHEGGGWPAYVEKEPVASWTLKPTKLNDEVESFRIDVNNLRDESADINIEWENTRITLPLELEVKSRVMANIDRVMAGPSWQEYWAAANYLNSTDTDLDKALGYVQKVVEMNSQFWNVRLEAVLLNKLGKKSEAIAAAEKSLKLAKEANNTAFIKMNEDSLKEWAKK